MEACAVCGKKLYRDHKKVYAYHETGNGYDQIGGFVTSTKRSDGSLNHACYSCYLLAKVNVCPLLSDSCPPSSTLENRIFK
jgi:hypothetical protein